LSAADAHCTSFRADTGMKRHYMPETKPKAEKAKGPEIVIFQGLSRSANHSINLSSG
jgi:hypothetical protein